MNPDALCVWNVQAGDWFRRDAASDTVTLTHIHMVAVGAKGGWFLNVKGYLWMKNGEREWAGWQWRTNRHAFVRRLTELKPSDAHVSLSVFAKFSRGYYYHLDTTDGNRTRQWAGVQELVDLACVRCSLTPPACVTPAKTPTKNT